MDQPSFELYTVKNFFSAETSRELIAEMRNCATAPALTYGKGDAAVDDAYDAPDKFLSRKGLSRSCRGVSKTSAR